jgi:prolipoprotein diacylglyceryltransferase
MVYISWYSVGRFAIQYLRLDDVKFWGLQEAHLIALAVLSFTIPFMIMKVRKADTGLGIDENGDNRGASRRKRDRQRQQAKS